MSKRRKQTARIYYNEPGKAPLWWTVRVTDAKKSVEIDSTLADALAGRAGSTVGCHLSNCSVRNAAAFPHAILLATFTRGVALMVDQVKNGQPSHAIRYYHKYAHLVDLNDTDKNKETIKANPELAERKLTLQKPWKSTTHGAPGAHGGAVAGKRRMRVPSGSMGRAVRAGLISKPVAEALSR